MPIHLNIKYLCGHDKCEYLLLFILRLSIEDTPVQSKTFWPIPLRAPGPIPMIH